MLLTRVLIFVLVLMLIGGVISCSEAPDSRVVVPQVGAVDAAAGTGLSLSADQQRLWRQSCALCHVDGNGGAPRVGDYEQWASRLEKGHVVLLANTIEGFNYMPPLGYCMACEREDFSALIEFMAGELK